VDQQTLSVTAPANGNEGPLGPYMLFVIGPNGAPSMASMTFLAIDTPPTASFIISCPSRSCNANASASSDDVGIAGYQWNWGDSQSSSGGPIASHTYGVDGTYNVTLTVSDTIGQTGSTARSVPVFCSPGLGTAPTATPSTITAGQTSRLETGDATGKGILTYLWYKSDGTLVGTSTNKRLNVSPTISTSYYYKVSNSCGTTGPSPTVTVVVQ
jgi:hypothetical protein